MCFVFYYSLLPIPCVERHWLPFFHRIEHFVEELYRLFGPELHGAHAGAYQSLLHNTEALLELAYCFLEARIGYRCVRLFAE